MSHETFSLQEVSDYLHISCADVEVLVREDSIPHEKQGGRVVFRKRVIDAWATKRILGLPGKQLAHYHKTSSAKVHDLSQQHAIMPELMCEQHIDPWLTSKTMPSTVRAMVKLANGTGLIVYPEDLLERIVEREKAGSTAMHGGFALLHPHYHEPYMFEDSFMVLGRSIQPIPFGSSDGGKTDLFFFICGQDDRIHLHVLARLCMMCKETDVIEQLRAADDASDMLAAILSAEEKVIKKL